MADDNLANPYDDPARADAYATFECTGTYYLAYRDLPAIIGTPAPGSTALDFGCGAGRSTRFLRSLGFRVTGIDIAEAMVGQARLRDPDGDYRVVAAGDWIGLTVGGYDLILAAFPFDNVAPAERKVELLRGLRSLLRPGGRIVNVSAAPAIVLLDGPDRRPMTDTLWTEDGHREVYRLAGLNPGPRHRHHRGSLRQGPRRPPRPRPPPLRDPRRSRPPGHPPPNGGPRHRRQLQRHH